jgi:hypothetical protein
MRGMLKAMDSSLSPFFDPQGVVVIGISFNPAKLGYGIAQNLANCGYRGAIHFVNPKGGTLFDRPVYVDVSQVPRLGRREPGWKQYASTSPGAMVCA